MASYKRWLIDNDLIIYAFRYALGRRSYVVSDVVSALADLWDKLKYNQKVTIRNEIMRALEENKAGDSIDRDLWKTIIYELS